MTERRRSTTLTGLDPIGAPPSRPLGAGPGSRRPTLTGVRALPPGFDRALVKGAAIREFMLWYESRYGTQHHAKILARVVPEAMNQLDPNKPALGILASTWYPPTVLFPILDVVSEGLSRAEQAKLALDGTDTVVRVLMRGLYQTLFRMVASPSLYAKYIQRAWNILHTSGKRVIVIEQEGVAISTIADWPGHHPLMCEITTATMKAVFEAMGCVHVGVERVACVSDGAAECRCLIRYEGP